MTCFAYHPGSVKICSVLSLSQKPPLPPPSTSTVKPEKAFAKIERFRSSQAQVGLGFFPRPALLSLCVFFPVSAYIPIQNPDLHFAAANSRRRASFYVFLPTSRAPQNAHEAADMSAPIRRIPRYGESQCQHAYICFSLWNHPAYTRGGSFGTANGSGSASYVTLTSVVRKIAGCPPCADVVVVPVRRSRSSLSRLE